nr:zinc finger protein 808 [Parasteatoda tepidariorum]
MAWVVGSYFRLGQLLNVRQFSCSICSKTFNRKDSLKTTSLTNTQRSIHLFATFALEDLRLKYDGNFIFNNAYIKRSKINKSSNNSNDYCSYEFSSEVEAEKWSSFYHCSYCGKQFARRDNLKVHERIHTGQKLYKCTFCDHSANHLSNLKVHIKLKHTKGTMKVCFIWLIQIDSILKAHLEYQDNGITFFHCSTCGKSFNRRDNLKVHERIHAGQKFYKCDYCNHQSNQLSNLKKHIFLKHTKTCSEICHICGKSYSAQSLLKNHMSKAHSFH